MQPSPGKDAVSCVSTSPRTTSPRRCTSDTRWLCHLAEALSTASTRSTHSWQSGGRDSKTDTSASICTACTTPCHEFFSSGMTLSWKYPWKDTVAIHLYSKTLGGATSPAPSPGCQTALHRSYQRCRPCTTNIDRAQAIHRRLPCQHLLLSSHTLGIPYTRPASTCRDQPNTVEFQPRRPDGCLTASMPRWRRRDLAH